MNRCAWFIGFLLLNTTAWLRAQCIEPAFVLQSSACLNENIAISNTTIGGYSFEWDFCAGDLKSAPTGTDVLNNTNFFRARSVRLIQDEGQWYAFAISATDNILMRLDFGMDVTSVPIVTNLGNVGSVLSTAFAFDMVKESNTWHILVANGGAKNIIRYSFTNGITSTPQVSTLEIPSVFDAAGPNFIRIIKDGSNYFAFVSVGTTISTKVIRLSLGTTITNNAPSVSEFTVTGANELRGMSFVKECDQWYGFALSQKTNTLYRLAFGTNPSDNPIITQISSSVVLRSPVNIEIRNEGANYYALIQSARLEGYFYKVSFGESIASTSVTTEEFIIPELVGSSNGGYALDVIETNSEWYGFTFNLDTRNLIRFDFENTCSATEATSITDSPIISYFNEGKYYVALKSSDTNGNNVYALDSVTVTSQVAPDITFTTQNICVNHDVNFTSQNLSSDIVQYDWDFGDTNTSSDENPVHQYTSNGEYNVELVVTAQNGCKNLARQSLTMFNEPIPDFTIPSVNPICTNQNYLFENISSVDPGYAPVWEWEINGTSVSTNEDLSYTFANTLNQEIKLIASIPGCESEMIKNINTLIEGPQPDFTVTGHCEDASVDFINTSSGDATGYTWDFNDGNQVSTIDATHVFTNPGVYAVILTASNAAGCNNTISKSVTIYSAPVVNFTALLPPFSCSGTPTQFNNLTPNPTDSNIASWLWDFGDTGSSDNTAVIKNPQHNYSIAGEYDVTLTVTTNFLCESTLQLPVAISQSPIADFNFTPTCEDVSVDFTDTSTGTIQSWSWQIGSSFYSAQNPTHIFSNPVSTNAMLMVTADNNCISSITKPIVVPAKLNPDFSVSKNCIEQQALFTDITNDTADPVKEYDWDFAGLGNATGSLAQFIFSTLGSKNVMLTITTETGCEYSVIESINIINPPQANFTALPNAGSQPLEVQFTNTSVEAMSYVWYFNDSENSTSFEVSPVFVFEEPGEYEVSLIAYNSLNCSDTTAQQILVSPITSLDEEGNFHFKTPYPNPTREDLFLGWTANQSGNLSIKILDAVGRVLQVYTFQSNKGLNEAFINLSGMNPGVYFIQMRLDERERTFRVMVTQE